MQQMHTKRRNRWLEEYIGRTFAVICGWLIVLITVTMIIFLGGKGNSVLYGQRSFAFRHVAFDAMGSKRHAAEVWGAQFLLLARCSSRLALC